METIFELENGCLSENHLIMTDNGWIKAKELKIGDNIIDTSGKVVKVEKIHNYSEEPNASIDSEIN